MDRRKFLETTAVLAASTSLPSLSSALISSPSSYEIAAYYFGNYHVDPRNEAAHGPGWTEWNLVRAAQPRFPGHQQPKVPLWGYENEADPKVFARKIDAAADHGLTSFIFDWYWYNDGPFLGRALEEGFLKAENCSRMKFGIMWANHNWFDIHPAKLASPPQLQFSGAVTPKTFRQITDHVIKNYFQQPNYLKIDNCPYFSIYEAVRFIEGLGGMSAAAAEVAAFRDRVKQAGFPDLHFNVVVWGEELLPGQSRMGELKSFLNNLGADSIGSYVWIHHTQFKSFPESDYADIADQYERYRETAEANAGKPYMPNVSVGWDSSPRACQTDTFISKSYPFTPVIKGNTPAAFGKYLRSSKNFLDASKPKHKMLTINSWNEWTEGSYLEPDQLHKFAYLEQIKEVFGSRPKS
jgi:hypothetical protein